MNLIKHLPLLATLFIVGCASQDTIIPSDGPEMKDIFRGALGENGDKAGVHATEAEQVCALLKLQESLDSCIEKTLKTLDENRLSLNQNPSGEELSYIEYTRTAENEIESLGKRLPNIRRSRKLT